jgi:hypothetical protein
MQNAASLNAATRGQFVGVGEGNQFKVLYELLAVDFAGG